MKYESKPSVFNKVKNGKDGASGNGLSNIVTQYYVSTSKTSQTGGSWSENSPTWSKGKYLWIRDKVTYTNGTVTYTTPYCDSSWESVSNLDDQILAWCYNNDKTYINGSKIYTGSITADKIKANNLSSISANLGTVTAGTIKGTTIDGATIKGGTISSGTTINVATDLTVGNNVYLGSMASSENKFIKFTDNSFIWKRVNGSEEWVTVQGDDVARLVGGSNSNYASSISVIGYTDGGLSLISMTTDKISASAPSGMYINDKKVAVAGDYSPLGNTDGTGMDLLWSGTSQAPSFTVSNINQYKFFLVQPGDADSSYGTMIVVPRSGSHASGHFRGIGGYETTSNKSGGEIFFLRGTVSGNTISIASCWSRKTASMTTNGSTEQKYIKYVVGVK